MRGAFFCKKPPFSNIFPLTNGKSVILYSAVILQNFIPYQEWLRERPDETTATCLPGKVPNPTSLLTSTDEERFYARSVEWRGVHFSFEIMLHFVVARNTENK